jgi:hypothetical protein
LQHLFFLQGLELRRDQHREQVQDTLSRGDGDGDEDGDKCSGGDDGSDADDDVVMLSYDGDRCNGDDAGDGDETSVSTPALPSPSREVSNSPSKPP